MKSHLENSFKKGEPWAFEEIYRKFLHPIQNYIFSRVPNESIAQELTQDVFLKAFRFSENYQTQFALTTWLWTIAKNTIKDFKKQKKSTELYQATTDLSIEDFPSTAADPESLCEQRSLCAWILRRTKSLTKIQRHILELRYFHQFSYREISENLGITLASVKSLLHRTHLQLIETSE